MKLFVDTWGWLTLRDQKENRHSEVKQLYDAERHKGLVLYTTDYVLDETFTLFFRRLPFAQAEKSVALIDKAKRYLHLEYITPERFEQAKKLRLKFKDKPKISFTDLSSIVVMLDLSIQDILTEDDHFTQVGMAFRKVP